jgi:hypothetical protein
MKKTALALTLVLALLTSLAVGVRFVSFVEANPYMMYEGVEPIPGTIPTKIAITSPTNYTAYSGTAVKITLHVTGPQTPYPTKSGISGVGYNIDGTVFPEQNVIGGWDLVPEVNYSEVLYDLPAGNHELNVFAYGVVEPGPLQMFSVDTTSTVFFSIGSTPYSSTPSSPTPPPTPTPTTTPEPAPEAEPFPTTLVFVASLGIGLAIVGLLVYFRRRQSCR